MLFIKSQDHLNQISETNYENEDQIQAYIYENPQILPIEELTGNKKLLVLIRELSTQYGRLDGLWIDEAGNVYIIETKLLKNPDRRHIIAQLLDYWVALWTAYKDPQDLITYLENKQINIKTSIAEHFQTSEEMTDNIIENFKSNIKQGIYQFVAVTDGIEKRILEQIHFINQSSKFSFYLVDLKYYRHQDSEFIIPKWYGGEIIKQNTTSNYSSKAWNENDFFDTIETNIWYEAKYTIDNIINQFKTNNYIVEYRQWKTPTVRIYDNKNDNFLVNIYSKNWDIVLYRNSKISTPKRWDFYKKVFDIDFTKTEKTNYTIKYDEYKSKSINIS